MPTPRQTGSRVQINVNRTTGRTRIRFSGGWRLAGRLGSVSTGVISIAGALGAIDSALTRLEKTQKGSVGPEVAKAIAAVRKRFPTVEQVRKQVRHFGYGKDFPRAKKWLSVYGWDTVLYNLTYRDDSKAKAKLVTMLDHMNTVYQYALDLARLENEYDRLIKKIEPVHAEVRWRYKALSEAVYKLDKVHWYKFPTSWAQAMFLGILDTFRDAFNDMAKLEGVVGTDRKWSYEEARRLARKRRIDAIRVFNEWAPRVAKVKKGPDPHRLPYK